jgi:hypothetical protein
MKGQGMARFKPASCICHFHMICTSILMRQRQELSLGKPPCEATTNLSIGEAVGAERQHLAKDLHGIEVAQLIDCGVLHCDFFAR